MKTTPYDGEFMVLACGDGGPFQPLPAMPPITSELLQPGDQPRLFLKDLLADGEYRHPVEDWVLSVTPARRQKWRDAFAAMRAARRAGDAN